MTLGYAMMQEAEPPATVIGSRPIELVRIYVEKDIIGRGYGAALMEACLETARTNGNEPIWLGVWEKNRRAIGFYEKWGFEKNGMKTFVLGNDLQNDHIMVKPIIPGIRSEPDKKSGG